MVNAKFEKTPEKLCLVIHSCCVTVRRKHQKVHYVVYASNLKITIVFETAARRFNLYANNFLCRYFLCVDIISVLAI